MNKLQRRKMRIAQIITNHPETFDNNVIAHRNLNIGFAVGFLILAVVFGYIGGVVGGSATITLMFLNLLFFCLAIWRVRNAQTSFIARMQKDDAFLDSVNADCIDENSTIVLLDK